MSYPAVLPDNAFMLFQDELLSYCWNRAKHLPKQVRNLLIVDIADCGRLGPWFQRRRQFESTLSLLDALGFMNRTWTIVVWNQIHLRKPAVLRPRSLRPKPPRLCRASRCIQGPRPCGCVGSKTFRPISANDPRRSGDSKGPDLLLSPLPRRNQADAKTLAATLRKNDNLLAWVVVPLP